MNSSRKTKIDGAECPSSHNFKRTKDEIAAMTKNENVDETGGLLHSRSLRDAIKPLILLNSIFSIGILEFNTSRSKRNIGLTYITIVIVVYLIILCCTYNDYMDQVISIRTDIEAVTMQAQFYCNVLSMFGMVLFGFLRLKDIRNALLSMEACDKTLEDMGAPRNYRQLVCFQFKSITFIILPMVIMLLADDVVTFSIASGKNIVLIAITEHYPVIVMSIVDYTFFFWVRYSRIKFEQLNDLLRGMSTITSESPRHRRVLRMTEDIKKNRSSSIYYAYQMSSNVIKMKKAKKAHLELIKCTRRITRAYGLHIFLSTITSFIFIVTLMFNSYTTIWLNSIKLSSSPIISMIHWCLFYTIKIILLNHVCVKAKTEAANTGDIICKLYEPSTSKEFLTEIREFTLQIIQNPLSFNAYGFFEMDHTFTYDIIKSITTYLIIFVQVGEMP